MPGLQDWYDATGRGSGHGGASYLAMVVAVVQRPLCVSNSTSGVQWTWALSEGGESSWASNLSGRGRGTLNGAAWGRPIGRLGSAVSLRRCRGYNARRDGRAQF